MTAHYKRYVSSPKEIWRLTPHSQIVVTFAGLHFTYPQDKQKAQEAAARNGGVSMAAGAAYASGCGAGHPEDGTGSGPGGAAVRGPPGDERQRLIAGGERDSAAAGPGDYRSN